MHFDYGHGYDVKDYGGEGQNPEKAPNMIDVFIQR